MTVLVPFAVNRGYGRPRNTNQRFLVNEAGERVAVLIDLVEYERLVEALEELESIRAYDSAKTNQDDEAIPFGQAVAEIEQHLQ